MKKILVIEDEAETLENLVLMLEMEGFKASIRVEWSRRRRGRQTRVARCHPLRRYHARNGWLRRIGKPACRQPAGTDQRDQNARRHHNEGRRVERTDTSELMTEDPGRADRQRQADGQ